MNNQKRIDQENQLREPYHRLLPNEGIHVNKLISKVQSDNDLIGIIRYGSSVKSNNYRDIDLCIISKNIEISTKKEYGYRTFLPEKYDVHFLHSLPLYIRHRVIKEGIFEYIGNYDELFDICVNSIKEYSLFEPRFRKYLELIENY